MDLPECLLDCSLSLSECEDLGGGSSLSFRWLRSSAGFQFLRFIVLSSSARPLFYNLVDAFVGHLVSQRHWPRGVANVNLLGGKLRNRELRYGAYHTRQTTSRYSIGFFSLTKGYYHVILYTFEWMNR